MEKQKTKLGARVLSKAELNAILPNAESIYEQIEVFRNNIPEKPKAPEKARKEVWEQKTNNIGIMGRRGAGKTSILKTFHEGLKGRNDKNDIILPIIIPENMSADTSLMDVVLGMLKSEVEKKKEEKKKEQEKGSVYSDDCIYSGRDSLEKEYNELVKQYCYIKKDYRDILIQQFTTEQNYVDKTTQVFNSDTEFIRRFNIFIEKLLCPEEKQDMKSMIYLFIDDIDLSTTKCMDVVRTLLSYLSNPRIVTFISGDMGTFEEALTLEFLRQEKALSKEVFDEVYYSVTDSDDGQNDAKLLERKKALAYEYLKKIVPPAYRRTIKYWALEERGNYLVGNESETEKNNAGKTDKEPEALNLSELLCAVTGNRVDKAYFTYKKGVDSKYMGVTFHMFDDTSRGLNNVYNVLQELYNVKEPEGDSVKGVKDPLMLWRLIETIEDSNILYAKHKETLRKKIIVLEGNQILVNFDNAFRILYGNEEEEKEKKRINGFDSKERFTVFLLIDFAARLSCCGQPEASGYGKLKNRIVREYLIDDTIDDEIAVSRDWKKWQKKEENKADKVDIWSILAGLLEKGDFIFILYLIKFLGREDIYNILVSSQSQRYADSNREYAYKIAYALAQTVWAMRETEEERKKYLADLYICLPNEMMALLSKLALNPKVIYGNGLMEDENPGFGKYFSYENSTWRDASVGHVESYMDYLRQKDFFDKRTVLRLEYENECLRYSIYYSMLLNQYGEKEHRFNFKEMTEKLVYRGLTVAIMNQLQDVMDYYKVGKLRDAGYKIYGGESGKPEKRESQEKQVIALIDEKDMWATPYARTNIYTYLKRKKKDYINLMGQGRLIFEASELFASDGAYSALKACFKGSSGKALANRLMKQVNNILFLSKGKEGEERFSDGRYYLSLEQVLTIQCLLDGFLRSHPRIRYAKKEARQLFMKLGEMPLVIRTNEWGGICSEIKAKEKNFFDSVFQGSESDNSGKSSLHDSVVAKIGGMSILESIAESAYSELHGKGWIILQELKDSWPGHRELLQEGKRAEADYFQYYMQQKIIARLEGSLEKNDNQNVWEEKEPVIPKEDYMFIFHSYLRYLQENDNDAEKAGARAEDIVKLAEYMLESEVIADKQIQNEVYEIINEELHISEEEFEGLFIM